MSIKFSLLNKSYNVSYLLKPLLLIQYFDFLKLQRSLISCLFSTSAGGKLTDRLNVNQKYSRKPQNTSKQIGTTKKSLSVFFKLLFNFYT